MESHPRARGHLVETSCVSRSRLHLIEAARRAVLESRPESRALQVALSGSVWVAVLGAVSLLG